MTRSTLIAILSRLYSAAETATSVGSLAESLDLTPGQVATGLRCLEDQGLVDARRIRLTLSGLAIAAAVASGAKAPRLRAVLSPVLRRRLEAA